jgi:hypothetical protein
MVWPEKLVQRYDRLVFARVRRLLGKEKVPGSNPGVGSTTHLKPDFVFISKLSEGAGRLKCGRLVVLNVRHGMRRIAGLAIAGTLAAVLIGGCSSSSAGLSGLTVSCPPSSDSTLGFASGPVSLSGQDSWYSEGQVAILSIDSRYTGPLSVRGSELGGEGRLRITLADLPPADLANIAAKESQHSVAVVSAVDTPEGGLELQADLGSPSSRAWFGWLSTDGPGCFGLQVNGSTFNERIVLAVHAGPKPPG